MTIFYNFGGNMYINITNGCPCKCVFCIRDEKETLGEAKEMWHDHNPSFEEIKAAIDDFDFAPYTEAVFCGYGEPTCSYNNLIAAASHKSTVVVLFSTTCLVQNTCGKKILMFLFG